MQWVHISLAASLTFSIASCYINDTLEAGLIVGSHVLSGMTSPRHLINKPNDSQSDLQRRQSTGTCGASFNGQKCDPSLCCSQFGYCGTGDYYCGEAYNCQPQYGRCGNAPPPSSTPVVSSSTSTPLPPSSTFTPPPITSSSTSSSVIIIPTSSTTVSSTAPGSTLVITTNGMCGNSTTCAGSVFGSCCSQYWYCGNTNAYCGTGCNPLFGSCGGPGLPSSSSITLPPTSSSTPVVSSTSTPPVVSTSTSSAPPTQTSSPGSGLPVSTDGTCGNGITCLGSTFGNCCSEYNFCGSSSDYCRLLFSCQPLYGTCT